MSQLAKVDLIPERWYSLDIIPYSTASASMQVDKIIQKEPEKILH